MAAAVVLGMVLVLASIFFGDRIVAPGEMISVGKTFFFAFTLVVSVLLVANLVLWSGMIVFLFSISKLGIAEKLGSL